MNTIFGVIDRQMNQHCDFNMTYFVDKQKHFVSKSLLNLKNQISCSLRVKYCAPTSRNIQKLVIQIKQPIDINNLNAPTLFDICFLFTLRENMNTKVPASHPKLLPKEIKGSKCRLSCQLTLNLKTLIMRQEERRVGKHSISRWYPNH